MIGRTIGKYRIVGQLGRGGAGVVYRAVDETLGRDVAVKTLNPDLADTEVMARFRAEATTLARLNHPQIATIFELLHVDNEFLMVMELVRGETLDKVCERLGPIDPERAAYVIDLILSALEHAHRAGVVHRDVKPANVMVTSEGSIKIMDFGIARVLGAEQKTVDGRLMGTPAYMAPEQVLGEELDGRADLYSVGVLFYRLVTGSLPFRADSALGMLQRQIRDEPTPLREYRADLPKWCEEIVELALMKAPGNRFQSAEEFRDALARATGPLPLSDLARTFAGSSLAPGPTDTVDLSRQEALAHAKPRARPAAVRAKRASRRGFVWGYSLAAVVVIGVAVAGYTILPGNATATAIPATPAPPAPAATVADALPAKAPGITPEPVAGDDVAPAPRVESPKPAAPPPVRSVRLQPDPPIRAEAAPRLPVAPNPEPVVAEERPAAPPAPAVVHDPALAFETRVLVGTKKPKEYNARLLFGDGRITVVPADDPTSILYSVPYGRVLSISNSHGRDPLWNSPTGATAIARGGGMMGRFGIVVERNWISLRTSTEDQFVAMRVEKVLEQRVLLALEERTGRKPDLVEGKDD